MSKTSGLGDNAYVGGYDLSGDVLSLSKISGGPATLDVTPINASAHVRIGGLRTGEIDFTAAFDNAAGAEHPALSTRPTTDVLVSYYRGTTLGNPAANMLAKQVNYDPTRGADGMLTLSVQALSNGYGLEWGRQLTPGNFTSTSALTGNASTFEGGIANWAAATNCTIAQSSAQSHGGTKSLALTSVTSGTMTARSSATGTVTTTGIPVAGGASCVVSGWFRSAVSARTCNMQVTWYDSSGSSISTTSGSTITDSTSAWTQASSAHTAPATAAYAIVLAQVASTGGASEVHYVDDVLFVTGTGSIDNSTGGSTAFGLQAYLQVFSFTGTDATVTIQDSADNASFSNLTGGGFTQITTAPGFQRIATSNSATVREYLRLNVTTSAGYTSLGFAVAIVRNLVAGQVF